MVVLERQSVSPLPAAVAPSTGPVAPEGVAFQVGGFRAGRPTGEIYITPPDSIPSQSPLYTEDNYQNDRQEIVKQLEQVGLNVQSRDNIVRDFDALRAGNPAVMAEVHKAEDDIATDNLSDDDRESLQELRNSLGDITPEQGRLLLTLSGFAAMSGLTAVGLWLDRKYKFSVLNKTTKFGMRFFEISGSLATLGFLCSLFGQGLELTQTAPAPDGSPPPSPTPASPDKTSTPAAAASSVPAPDASHIPEPATNIPPGYDVKALLGSAQEPNAVVEAITREGNPVTEAENAKYIKAHKFSEEDLVNLKNSKSEQNTDGIPQFGITATKAESILENIQLLKDLTAVTVKNGQVYYFSNGLVGDAFRGFMLLVSADGNSVWQAKNEATLALNHFPNTFSGIDLTFTNIDPDDFSDFLRPWQPADAAPQQETDRMITPVDISSIGGIEQLNVVFQRGTENAYLVYSSVSVKSGADVVMSVFDASAGKWLEILDIPQDAILPADWAAYTAEDENKGKLNPEMFFQLVGGINHENRKTVSLESDGLKIAVSLDAQYLTDHGIDPLLGLTVLSQVDQIALAEALSVDLDGNQTLKEQLASIRSQIENNPDKLLRSKDVAKYAVIVQSGKVTGVVFYDGTDVARRYSLDAERKLVQLTPEQEPQLLPELTVDGPYIKRADTGEVVKFKGVTVFLSDTGRGNESVYSYVKRVIDDSTKLGVTSNILRLSYHTRTLSEQNKNDFVELAKYCSEKGIYIIITPHNDQTSQQNDNFFLPNEQDQSTLVDLASKLKNENNIIFGIWNEPANTSWSNWGNILARIYSKLEQEFKFRESKPIILVPGIEWSRDFRNAQISLPKNSYIIDVHNYPIPIDSRGDSYTLVESWWSGMIGKIPIMITEAGYLSVRPGSTIDLKVISNTYDIIHQNPPGQIGYTSWREYGDQGIMTLGGNKLTARGMLTKSERESFPDQSIFTR